MVLTTERKNALVTMMQTIFCLLAASLSLFAAEVPNARPHPPYVAWFQPKFFAQDPSLYRHLTLDAGGTESPERLQRHGGVGLAWAYGINNPDAKGPDYWRDICSPNTGAGPDWERSQAKWPHGSFGPAWRWTNGATPPIPSRSSGPSEGLASGTQAVARLLHCRLGHRPDGASRHARP